MKKYFLTILFLFFSTTYCFSYTQDEAINVTLYEKINPSIVSISGPSDDGYSSGTGCIISPDGYILTSKHIINDINDIEVKTKSGKTYKGEVAYIFLKNNDLAIIKINTSEKFLPLKLGNSEKIKVGQKVLAIGNPFGFNGTLTTGIISRIDYAKNKIQTDAAINPGSSGGPLVDTKGEIIGINQAIYNPDNNSSNIGIGFAIPINDAKNEISLLFSNKTKK